MENKKKIIIPIVLIALLIIVTVGVTYAFFNYTRTGSVNTVKTGRIYFNHTQDGNIELSNVFPTNKNNLNSTNSNTVTINITGDTTYTEGIEYKVTLEEVNNIINNKEVPISIKATATNLGTEDSNYYTNRENKEKIYLLNEEGEAYNGKYIAVGYIPAGSTGVNGSIDITAFIDTNKIAITDTYLNETDEDWVMGREVFTTDEWNSFASTPLSFKVKVEANEGIWVEPEKFLTMKNISSDSNWASIRASITSIEFHKDGVVPTNYVTSFDVTDSTSDPTKGSITLYTIDDGLGNNTYKAIIVANDIIYAPENSSALFAASNKLRIFNSKNFRVDNTSNMMGIFANCQNLVNINSLFDWNVSNSTNMSRLFFKCYALTNINTLTNWNTSNVTTMDYIFSDCTSLVDINGLRNWNTSNVTTLAFAFSNCTNLVDISGLAKLNVENVYTFNQTFASTKVADVDALSEWKFRIGSSFTGMFYGCTKLKNLTGLREWDVSKIGSFVTMFYGCANLEDASGINDWDINPNARFTQMFKGVSVHPEFTKVSGTWDSEGTFTPNA